MGQTFGKEERLSLKRRFELLLKEGDSFFIYPFRVIYLQNAFEGGDFPAQVAFAVKKKQFKRAVDRNRIKRLCREAYRRQKGSLYDSLLARNATLLILMVYVAQDILPFPEMNKRTIAVINRLASNVKSGMGETNG
ncbi:MAG: ribonuclease P protein component [Bacteroidales bacterium]